MLVKKEEQHRSIHIYALKLVFFSNFPTKFVYDTFSKYYASPSLHFFLLSLWRKSVANPSVSIIKAALWYYYEIPPRSRNMVPAYCLLLEERNPVWKNPGHRLVLKFEGPLTSLVLRGPYLTLRLLISYICIYIYIYIYIYMTLVA